MTFSFATTTSESDWQEWVMANVGITDGGISLFQDAAETTTVARAVVDVATDPDGRLVVLQSDGTVVRYDPVADAVETVNETATEWISAPSAVAASDDQVFLAGEDGTVVTVPEDGEAGTVRAEAAHADDLVHWRDRLYAFEAGNLRTVEDDATDEDWSLPETRNVAFADGALYALEVADDRPVVRRYESERDEGDVEIPGAAFEAGGTPFDPTALAVAGGTVVVAGTPVEQAGSALFEWQPRSEAFERLAEFDGTCHELLAGSLADGDRRLYPVVGQERRCLAHAGSGGPATDGRDHHVGFAATRYDSGEAGLEWHRLTFVLARSSVDTRVRVWYHATDDADLCPIDEAETLQEEARETARELGFDSLWPFATADATAVADEAESVSPATVESWQETALAAIEAHRDAEWTHVDDPGNGDVLVSDAVGRYLFVAVELVGTATASPLVDSVTAYCPRTSYLRHMPELYRQDVESAAFLEQFLSVFETSFTDVQRELDRITRYFDPIGVPSDSLDWLEDWLAADEYRDWPERARREYLARAPELYKMRGTRAGLRETIELYLRHATDATTEPNRCRSPSGAAPQFEANAAQGGDTPTGERLFVIEPADIEAIDGIADEHPYESLLAHDRSFVVFCGPFESDAHRDAIETIVQTEKPAHTEASFQALESDFVLGSTSILGINAELGTESFSLGDASLGKDAFLSAGGASVGDGSRQGRDRGRAADADD